MSKRLGELQQLVAEKEAAEKDQLSTLRYCCMRGLKVLVYEAIRYYCMRPAATSV